MATLVSPASQRVTRTIRNATIAGLFSILAAPVALLWGWPRALFGGDWPHSRWTTAYIAEYLRIYHHAPNVIDTSQSLGIASPVFYGPLFFRLSGWIAVIGGPGVGLRSMITVLFTIQTLAVYRAARVLRAGRGVALLLCLATATSTYALTTLYNRGDLAEQAGLLLVGAAIAVWFWSLGVTDRLERQWCRAVIACVLTLLAGTHNVTLIFGACAFFTISVVTALVDRRRSTFVTIAIAAAACLCGALIFLTEYAAIGTQLRLAPGFHMGAPSMFADRIDSPFARFSPFPVDPQSVMQGLDGVSTPYLEAPIDYALMFLAVAVLLRRRDRLAGAFIALAGALAILSVWPTIWISLPNPLWLAGAAYRLTAYVNIVSLSAVLTLLWRMPSEFRIVARTSVPWVAGTVAILACLIKLSHAYAAMTNEPTIHGPSDLFDGSALAGVDAVYTTLPLTGPTAPPHQPPATVAMVELGAPVPQQVVADLHGFIFSRILVFPWNNVIVDGNLIDDSQKLSWRDYPYYGIKLRPFSEHTIQTSFALPRSVESAITFTQYTFFMEVLVTIVISGFVFRRRR